MDKDTRYRQALDHFGRKLMSEVRDPAIIGADNILYGRLKGINAEITNRLFANFDVEERASVSTLIPQIVDDVLKLLLAQIESSNMKILVPDLEGEMLSLKDTSDYLSLEIYEWIARFSLQRYETLSCGHLPVQDQPPITGDHTSIMPLLSNLKHSNAEVRANAAK